MRLRDKIKQKAWEWLLKKELVSRKKLIPVVLKTLLVFPSLIRTVTYCGLRFLLIKLL